MKKATTAEQTLHNETAPADYTPTQAQIDAFARRIMPEIKKFFADESIQQEFAAWKERKGQAE